MSLVTRTCKGCGWVFPSSYVHIRCKFCKTLFDEQICYICKQLTPTAHCTKSNDTLHCRCRPCSSKERMAIDKKYPEKAKARVVKCIEGKIRVANERFAKWVEMSNIYTKPMTQEEWIETCSYFEGCAICGKEHIEAREFFVPFKNGGKYAPYNMFPLCNSCLQNVKIKDNPFLWLDNMLGTAKKIGLTDERAEKLLAYFIKQIERYTNGQ